MPPEDFGRELLELALVLIAGLVIGGVLVG